MRYAARKDANKDDIVAALRRVGCYVYDLRQPVDLLASRAGKAWMIEIKDGAKAPSDRKLTPAQVQFMANWTGPKVITVTCVDEALQAVGEDWDEESLKAWQEECKEVAAYYAKRRSGCV